MADIQHHHGNPFVGVLAIGTSTTKVLPQQPKAFRAVNSLGQTITYIPVY